MATVEVSFSALPAHVRTARLVAVAVARRAGVEEAVLDEVRLAVGEACSRAVELHQRHAPDEPVRLRLTDAQDRFTVEVSDRGPAEEVGAAGATLQSVRDAALGEPPPPPAPRSEAASDPLAELLPPGFGLAVISGLVDEVEISQDANGTHVRMTWPALDVMAPEQPGR